MLDYLDKDLPSPSVHHSQMQHFSFKQNVKNQKEHQYEYYSVKLGTIYPQLYKHNFKKPPVPRQIRYASFKEDMK